MDRETMGWDEIAIGFGIEAYANSERYDPDPDFDPEKARQIGIES